MSIIYLLCGCGVPMVFDLQQPWPTVRSQRSAYAGLTSPFISPSPVPLATIVCGSEALYQ